MPAGGTRRAQGGYRGGCARTHRSWTYLVTFDDTIESRMPRRSLLVLSDPGRKHTRVKYDSCEEIGTVGADSGGHGPAHR